LIELMVTITILALLLLATMPGIGQWLRNTSIRNAAESLQNGLTRARAEAVRRNEIISFSLVTVASNGQFNGSCALSSTSASWVVSRDNPAGKCDVSITGLPPDAGVLSPYILAKQAQGDGSPNVTISLRQPNGGDPCGSGDTSSNSISFNGFGRLATSPDWATGPIRCLVVSGASGTRPLRVVIGTGGTVRMCDPAVTDANDPRRC
jgi:type IV fimbrial biogenesis protein FimT